MYLFSFYLLLDFLVKKKKKLKFINLLCAICFLYIYNYCIIIPQCPFRVEIREMLNILFYDC